ncbi:neuronal acetylcholine receptor subunit alpha-6-like [Ylistrum balloti]|uniref:neuronal acetylcholine receptor subunit alpha-6-like n=1 Tax=Ylistrum balloti TaxID=509963 RepID=UPI002905962B|nr:neuronal acetylcholine receptor subunit alpha-6-like [Ylistrum balloti]
MRKDKRRDDLRIIVKGSENGQIGFKENFLVFGQDLNTRQMTGSYNKFIRPVIDHNVPVILETRLNLVAILDVNAVEEKLTTTASLVLKWKDENLSWDPDDYGGVEELLIPQTEMWTPDMALDNNFNKMKGLGDGFVLINVKYDGSVYWEPYEVFVTKCAMNIENFPFDIQICHLNVGVWTNEIDKVLVRLDQDEISYEYFQENSEWDIIGQETQMFQTTTRNSMIEFSLKIKRKPQYYLYNIVAPILMLSILAVFTFAIPVESGEKLGFCMTVYLAFAVFLTIISSSLPVSSVMSLLGKYLLFLLIIGTLIVMICTLEIRIHFRRNSRRIPGCVQGLIIYHQNTISFPIKRGHNPFSWNSLFWQGQPWCFHCSDCCLASGGIDGQTLPGSASKSFRLARDKVRLVCI